MFIFFLCLSLFFFLCVFFPLSFCYLEKYSHTVGGGVHIVSNGRQPPVDQAKNNNNNGGLYLRLISDGLHMEIFNLDYFFMKKRFDFFDQWTPTD